MLNQRCEKFFHMLVSQISLEFKEPEQVIIKQNDDIKLNEFLFFIERGECEVKIDEKERSRNNEVKVRTLYPGDFFGEIAFLYNSKRSTTVKAKNYTTIGKISKEDVDFLLGEFPFFKTELIKRTIRYDDDLKLFLESTLKTIEYLHNVPDETIS